MNEKATALALRTQRPRGKRARASPARRVLTAIAGLLNGYADGRRSVPPAVARCFAGHLAEACRILDHAEQSQAAPQGRSPR